MLNNLQKLGVLGEAARVGRGAPLAYTPVELHRLLVAIELCELGVPPATTVALIASYWESKLKAICSDAERAAWARLPVLRGSTWGKITFVAKEAFYKCYSPVMKTFLEFYDVSVDFIVTIFSNGEPVGGEFTVRLLPRRGIPDVAFEPRGRWMLKGELALAAVAVLPAQATLMPRLAAK